MVRTGWENQVEVLHDGRVDVSYVRLPVDERGLRLVEVGTEPRVVALASTHRLAGKELIPLGDLAHEHLLQNPDAVPGWHETATEMRDRVPGAIEDGYGVEEKLENVARGRGIAVLPESVVRFYTRPDISTAAIADMPASRIAVAWESNRRSRLVREFVAIAAGLGSPAMSTGTP